MSDRIRGQNRPCEGDSAVRSRIPRRLSRWLALKGLQVPQLQFADCGRTDCNRES